MRDCADDISMQQVMYGPLRPASRALPSCQLPEYAFGHRYAHIIGVEMIIKYSCRHNDDRNQYQP